MAIFSSFLGRMIILGTFLFVSLSMFMYMLLQTGTYVPLLQEKPKTITFVTGNVDNLVTASQAQIAGVKVGEVLSSDATAKGGEVTFRIDSEHWPLHQGLKVRIGQRSLVGESYLDLHDGTGAPLPVGTVLPADAVIPVVNLYNVYDSLDPKTRATTSSMLQSLGASTAQTRDGLSATMDGLSSLGRSGHTAIDAIAAQNEDLRKLTQQTTTLLSALDTGEGQIADLVTSANKVTQATAGQRQSFEDTMRLLPDTLDNAKSASTSLHALAEHLAPVAGDLRRAAPQLSDALVELPDTTRDMRGLLPPADSLLDRAPKTLKKVSNFSDDVDDAIGPARDVLSDVNPVVGYLRPYGPDLAAFFANFNAALEPRDEAGRHFIRAMVFIDEKTLTSPVPISAGVYSNPYPKPGVGDDAGPFKGPYPRIERAPR